MKKRIVTIAAFMALAGSIFAQGKADNKVLPRHSTMTSSDHYGQSISKFDNYVLIGSTADDVADPADCSKRNQQSGGAVLYKNGQAIRAYKGKAVLVPGTDITNGDNAGHSVAMGAEWLAIGAPAANGFQGKVILVKKDQTGEFSTSITREIIQPTVADVTSGGNNRFGDAVAIGRSTLVISATGANFKGFDSGALFVYKLTNGVWNVAATLVPTSPADFRSFGRSVALSDDERKIIISGTKTDEFGSGTVLIYHNTSGNTWTVAKSIVSNDAFGAAIDVSNDRAVITSGSTTATGVPAGQLTILKLDAVQGWITDQQINTGGGHDVAIEGTKLVYGQVNNVVNGGRIVHMVRSGTASSPWVQHSSVGLTQGGTAIGFSVDLANNQVAAGAFSYDFADIADHCFPVNGVPRPDEHAGAAVLYGFDEFSNQFFMNDRNFRAEGQEEEAAGNAALQSVLVSPNPAESDFVTLQSASAILEVQAVSTAGTTTALALQNNQANISSLEAGLYVLQIKTENGVSVQKLVVR